MRELTCIVCPVGCTLSVDDSLTVSGNLCPRGEVYAKEEVIAPKRVVTATCKISGAVHNSSLRRIPVKTSAPCPREKIGRLLEDIYRTSAVLPVKAGDVLIADWGGSGIDVVATRDLG